MLQYSWLSQLHPTVNVKQPGFCCCTVNLQRSCITDALDHEEELRRSDEPGAWYAMLPLEVVYAFDPVPPEPQHEEPPTPMSRSGDGDSDGSGMDVEASSNGMGDGWGVSHTPAYADWTLPAKDAHHIIGGQVLSSASGIHLNIWASFVL